MNNKKLILIDAYSVIYRAYYAFKNNPIINSKNLNTSAIYGFGNMLIEVLKNEKPSHVCVAFDTADPTFRHIEFVSYKANRESMPEEISLAIPYIFEFLKKINIKTLSVSGFEADDIIGTLAKKAEKNGFTVYIMTTDKDFGQLVSDKIFVYQSGKFGSAANLIGVKEVCAKYEIQNPNQLIDILGLWGDASDNIPGVPGIGEVKAKKLIQQFGSIENLLKNIDQIENIKVRKIIEENIENAIFSKKLVTIETSMNIDFKEDDYKWVLPDPEPIKEFFKELEFKTFAKRYFDTFYQNYKNNNTAYGIQTSLFDVETNEIKVENVKQLNNIKTNMPNYKLVTNMNEFSEMMQNLSDSEEFAFDTETTGLDIMSNEIIGISFSCKKNIAYYLPLVENYLHIKDIIPFLQILFEDEEKVKIAHNIKFDYRMLAKHGVRIQGKCFDTMIAHYLLNPDNNHSLDSVAESLLNYQTISFIDIVPMKNPGPNEILKVPVETMKDYSSEDADITLQLYYILNKKLEKEGLKELFENIEMKLVFILAAMENEGVKINSEDLFKFSIELSSKISSIEQRIFQLSGKEFNLNSPKQLGEILFEKLKISDKPPKTKTKQYSTGEEVLIKFSKNHEIIPLILQHRSLSKLKSTYVEALPKYVSIKTGRIHTIFNQTVTTTGRLSSTNPNLQNIPIRSEYGQEIRKAFIPFNENSVIMSADYSQIELRVIAAMSNEENMVSSFKNKIDIHNLTASKIFNIPIESITSNHRRIAKTVNFGIIYGISAFGLSERIDLTRKESENLINEYFKKFPKIKTYMQNTIEFAKKNGYVLTKMNRKRYIPNINSTNGIIRGYAERNAINAPIQGTAADIIKLAMIKVFNQIAAKKLKSRLILQIHDELVFNVEISELEIINQIVEAEMKAAFMLDVPIEVEIKYGKNWLEAH